MTRPRLRTLRRSRRTNPLRGTIGRWNARGHVYRKGSCSGTGASSWCGDRTGPGPPARVVEAFGLPGAAERLPGGQGETWRLGEAVLKPSHGEDFVRWVSDLLARLDGRCDFRVSPPLRARDGSWSFHRVRETAAPDGC